MLHVAENMRVTQNQRMASAKDAIHFSPHSNRGKRKIANNKVTISHHILLALAIIYIKLF